MTRKPSRRHAPSAMSRKLQGLYDAINHTPRLTREEKLRMRLEIAYLRAEIEAFGLLLAPPRRRSR